jgi:hypothetical protein
MVEDRAENNEDLLEEQVFDGPELPEEMKGEPDEEEEGRLKKKDSALADNIEKKGKNSVSQTRFVLERSKEGQTIILSANSICQQTLTMSSFIVVLLRPCSERILRRRCKTPLRGRKDLWAWSATSLIYIS